MNQIGIQDDPTMGFETQSYLLDVQLRSHHLPTPTPSYTDTQLHLGLADGSDHAQPTNSCLSDTNQLHSRKRPRDDKDQGDEGIIDEQKRPRLNHSGNDSLVPRVIPDVTPFQHSTIQHSQPCLPVTPSTITPLHPTSVNMLMSGEVPLHAFRSSLPGRANVGATGLESRRMSTKSANPQDVSRPKKKKRSWKKPTQALNHQTPDPRSITSSSQTPISTAESSLPKLRMDQIIEPPRLSPPGNTASSVRKWDHSLFKNQNYTPRLAYRPFKEVLPKNLPPRPRLPAAFPVQQLPAKREKVPPTAPRSHTILSEFSIPIRPEPRTSWQERSVSVSTSAVPERMEAGAVTASAQTLSPCRDHGTEIQMLERQVRSLTDRLLDCQNELREMRVKLDFANMTAGRSGGNLGNARREIKELKERIKELEYPSVEVKVEDDTV